MISFALSNKPTSFQGYINKIWAKKLDVFVIIYLDNILIYTKDTAKAHVDAVQGVLNKIKKHGLFTNLKKCRFYKNEFQFLGFIILAQGVKMKDEQIKAVKNWPKQKSMKDIQVFLSFANFYWHFI